MSKRKDDLEDHLLNICDELGYALFFDLCYDLPDFHDTLHDKLLLYRDTQTRRPINQDRMLKLRTALLDRLDQKEMAEEDGIKNMDIFTDEQKQAAKEIAQSDDIRARQRITTEVLPMDAPAGVRIQLDEHDRISSYAGYLPAYAAYALIDHYKKE